MPYIKGEEMLIVRKKSGFTLIELLVVIAIIAILAAILFPVFAKVREKARQTSCLSNEKQIGLSFAQYYQDYDEKWPIGVTTATATPVSGFGWAGTVSQYIKATGLLKCPDDNTSIVAGTPTEYPVSYGYNSNIAGQSDAAFTAPSSTVAMFEVQGATSNVTSGYTLANTTGDGATAVGAASPTFTNSSFADNGLNVTGQTAVIFATSQMGGTATPANVGGFGNANGLHTGGSNFLLADGHAKWFRGAAVSPGFTNTSATGLQLNVAGAAAGTSATGTPTFAATFSIN